MNLAMCLYYTAHTLYKRRLRLLANVFCGINRAVCACQIPASACLDKSVCLLHNGLGVVIHEKANIGKNVKICQHVTIGGGRGEPHPSGSATIEENVLIGANAVLLGPIHIGKNAKIGANAVCLTDVPENAVAVGNPARIILKNISE